MLGFGIAFFISTLFSSAKDSAEKGNFLNNFNDMVKLQIPDASDKLRKLMEK